jgi:hypothetical protein
MFNRGMLSEMLLGMEKSREMNTCNIPNIKLLDMTRAQFENTFRSCDRPAAVKKGNPA